VRRACPFRLCSTTVDMVIERADPNPMPNGLARVPQHPCGGYEEFGLCPGSLLYIPLTRYDADQLEAQAKMFERIIRDRDAAAAKPDPGPEKHGDWRDLVKPPEPYRPGREPQPDPNPHWFKDSQSTVPGGTPGQVAPPAMEPMYFPPTSPVREPLKVVGPETTTGGSTGVSTVEGVKAAIGAAGEICAIASRELFRIEGDIGRALELMNTIRETSIDPMGAPQISAAIEQVGEANASLRAAIEAGATYRAGM
jgi:hypothetical protein